MIIFASLSKQQHLSGNLTGETICMPFASYGITLAKHIAKQGGEIFFPSDRKLELTYFIDN